MNQIFKDVKNVREIAFYKTGVTLQALMGQSVGRS